MTDTDFASRLPSQTASTTRCHLLITTGCKLYFPEHVVVLQRAQTVQGSQNIVHKTVFRETQIVDTDAQDTIIQY